MLGDDPELIRRCLGGEVGAFEALHAAHAGRVTAYLLRSGFSPADADDLAQQIFVRAFNSLGTFDAARGSFSPWLAAIARNIVRKHWRRRKEPENFDPELAEAMFASPENPGQDLLAREEIEAVRACVDALPPELADIVRLRYVDGRTMRGIAAAANMPEATVRLRLKEAVAIVERCLRSKGILE